MNVLIWFPLYPKGGGFRLFVNLVSALTRHSKIEKVRIVLSNEYIINDEIKNLSANPAVEICYYPESKTNSETELHKMSPETTNMLSHWVLKPGRIMGIYGTRTLKKILQKTFYKRVSIIYNEIIKKEESKREKISETNINSIEYYANGYDVVYFFWPQTMDFHAPKKPSVCTFQDTIVLDFPENIGGANAKIAWEISKKWIEETTIVVTSSNYVKSRLLKYFGERCNSIVVIPHRGSPVEYFSQKEISKNLLDKLPPEYIVYPANLGFHKNHYNLLVAYSRFKYKKKYPLVLFGNFTEFLLQEPPNYPELTNCSRLVALTKRLDLKLNEDFYSLGYIKDQEVGPIIRNAKTLVMPSLAEGGGSYPVEEALRLGVPVACSDIPVMREHLEGRTPKIGWFDPESTDSIVNALNNVIEHYEEYKSLTLKGIKDQTQSWEDIANRYVLVFEKAIDIFRK